MVWVSVWLEGKRSLAVMETLEPMLPKSYRVELQNKQERFLKVSSFTKLNIPLCKKKNVAINCFGEYAICFAGGKKIDTTLMSVW